MAESYRALVVEKSDDGVNVAVKELPVADLPPGDVTVRVAYSTVNYKDGLALTANGRILRSYPMVPGIDLAGEVVASSDERFTAGEQVLITGYDLGVAHPGGFAEMARVPADWLVKLPAGLTPRQAMAIGTAGFTAALSVHRLEQNGLAPGNGPVLVSGATGGVGSTAVAMLAGLGYAVAASTGKSAEHEFLRGLGASEILSREEVSAQSERPLERERWAGGVDPVGGDTLAYMLRTTKYGGAVAVSGLTGGTAVHTTVIPFILRGISLLGIDSVMCPMPLRQQLWQRLAGDLKPRGLDESITHEIALDQVPAAGATILKGGMTGRTVVRL
jgi:putative YhdH/YhfP family quinone oxidoreductase